VFVLVCLLSAALLVQSRGTVFFALDDGLLAESAERVMHGQVPHRDFVDVYTGALGALDALAFRAWGVNLMAIRDLLCVAAILWVPLLWLLADRVASPWAAGLVVLAAVAWSVPYYPLGMPSWYVMFLACAGAVALVRYGDTRRRRWLILAGLAAGAACTIKITGLYSVAATLLTFVWLEQSVTERGSARTTDEDAARGGAAREVELPRVTPVSVLVVAGCALYALAVAVLVRRQGLDAMVTYAVPGAAIAAALAWRERERPHAASRERLRVYASMLVPFAAGLAVPIAILVAVYTRAGAIGPLLHGVFVTPMTRIAVMYVPPFPAVTVLAAVPVAAALGLFTRSARVRWAIAAVAVLALVASGAVQPYADAASRTPLAVMSRLVRDALRGLVPVVTVVGAVAIARRRATAPLVVLLSVLATGWLVMFPFAQDVYFHYAAPLVALATLALVATVAPTARIGPTIVGVTVLLYALVQQTVGIALPARTMVHLATPRGGPLVAPAVDAVYTRLVASVRAHARGRYIYAGPDSPDVYFLTGFENPTPTMYEAFDPPVDRARTIPPRLDSLGVTVAVVAHRRYVSGPIDPGLDSALARAFPQADTVGWFVVRWRAAAPAGR
jgi:hypothetical protein